MRSLPPHELYSLKLQCLDLGYALFEPNPNGSYDFVRIGDVGYISEDGKFMKLFNAFSDRNSQANTGSHFPERLPPITLTLSPLARIPPYLGEEASISTPKIIFLLTLRSPVSEFVAGGSLTLSCTSGTGAALITKYKGKRHKALASAAMESYMKSNVSSWVRLVRTLGRPVQMHDLIFVKECVLTGDWANISWNSTSCESYVGFSVGLPTLASLGVSFWGQWQQHIEVPKRQGPDREAPIPHGEVPNFDQCTFMKGIRVAERAWYSRLSSYLRIVWSEGRKDIERSILRALSDKNFTLKSVGDLGPISPLVRNVYDALAIYLFENSDAQYAVINERDIYFLDMHGADTVDDICEFLLNLAADDPTIKVAKDALGETGNKIRPILFQLSCSHTFLVARLSWSIDEELSDELVLLDENMKLLDVADEDLSQSQKSEGHMQFGIINKDFPESTPEDKPRHQETLSDSPPPPPKPSHHATIHAISTLHDYEACKKISNLEIVHKCGDPDHKPEWTTICKIDGVEYGRSTASKKKLSAHDAAQKALTRLCGERPDEFSNSHGYLPRFISYLAEYRLTETVELRHKETRPRGWQCSIWRNGKEIGNGGGSTKKIAAENAAIDAACNWEAA
ncbi:hypothetical protein A7U60_g3220 [Sanghuangporus baumii]|uniref:DRBM domain-containing protein n=1 Tax=Sanghuangporus baumii TaxID=108892 RepID=A0A9Q5I0U8_SANBA|nr:hypothetical protein A7U60_g3220 [Sanghuangporus baumii]